MMDFVDIDDGELLTAAQLTEPLYGDGSSEMCD